MSFKLAQLVKLDLTLILEKLDYVIGRNQSEYIPVCSIAADEFKSLSNPTQ